MIPVICCACGQRGKVASIPSDLVCLACSSDDIDLDDRTASADHTCKWCDKAATHEVKRVTKDGFEQGTDYACEDHAHRPGNMNGTEISRLSAISGDPDMPAGLLPNDQPEMGLLGDPQKITESIRCSTCFHQFTQAVTDPSAPMLPCPKCGADTTTAAGTTTASRTANQDGSADATGDTFGGEQQHLKGCALDKDHKGVCLTQADKERIADSIGSTAATDTRLPEEVTHQKNLESKPQSQLTGEEEVDLARLRQQQRGPLEISNPYGGGNPYKAKVEQITEAVLISNPGMSREAAREVAAKTVRRYPKVASVR